MSVGMQWEVRDPGGTVHVKRSKTKVFTHAVVRRNMGSDHYFVNWATSADRAAAEAKVLAYQRDFVRVVELDQKRGGPVDA